MKNAAEANFEAMLARVCEATIAGSDDLPLLLMICADAADEAGKCGNALRWASVKKKRPGFVNVHRLGDNDGLDFFENVWMWGYAFTQEQMSSSSLSARCLGWKYAVDTKHDWRSVPFATPALAWKALIGQWAYFPKSRISFACRASRVKADKPLAECPSA